MVRTTVEKTSNFPKTVVLHCGGVNLFSVTLFSEFLM